MDARAIASGYRLTRPQSSFQIYSLHNYYMDDYSKQLQNRVMTKSSKLGYCVICGSYGRLTRDHVPPKGCNNKTDVVLRAFFQSHEKTRKTLKLLLKEGRILKRCVKIVIHHHLVINMIQS